MQVLSSSPSLYPSFNKFSDTGFHVTAGDFSNDFDVMLQLKDEEPNKEQEEIPDIKPHMEEEEEEEEEEFSFVCLNPDGSPVSADDAFQNGQIRPVFPLFKQDLLFANEDGSILKSEDGEVSLRLPLKKLFVEESPDATSTSSSSEPAGPYCEWRGGKTVEETSPQTCKKSNSTGFSKLWRFRDLIVRSNSDGRDAFVFLDHSSIKTKKTEKQEKDGKVKVTAEKPKANKEKTGKTTSLSAHERLYVKNRAMREEDKRRSYLPYRQVGFFTNVNGLSRNVHPF